jgi:hypothetical protein
MQVVWRIQKIPRYLDDQATMGKSMFDEKGEVEQV